MTSDKPTTQISEAVNEGWVKGGSFLGSILAGTFLGMLADAWLETEPLLVIVGIVLGSYSGFMNMWKWAREAEDAESRP
ncbi:MAG: AtpZ/AtpI family protein [Acidimicrobiia bacterium]